MTKGRISLPLQFLIYLLLFAVVAFALSEVGRRFGAPVETTQDSPALKDFTVVLDAGHGGEDGGAVSASGIYEKNLNLSIAMLVRDLLEANGVKVVMTRETDILLYDRNVDYVGRKKALDLAARRQIAEQTPNAIFVSIHMNAYPQTQYRGLQVWYSPNNHGSEKLADKLV